ncbi:hypothetical protein [Micromonospora sp. NBC_00421]|uniref:hypothetical protein n=1 Tax=Micromonospora sp. NBC_00421 TaxID=2975976 RepID=UPI002E22F4E4
MIIESRYNGPPGSGNGGWSAGVFAEAYGADRPVEVTLRRPPPLDTPLTLTDGDVYDPDGHLVAEVRPADDPPAPVPPVDPATAHAASAGYPGLVDHPFPGCYVCGPEHPDGLRIFPGRLPDGRTAAPWRTPQRVTAPTAWAALDCPGGWTVIAPGRPYVLGRLAVALDTLPEPGEQCVVTGAVVTAEGRLAVVHTSLYGSAGGLLGRARATWVALPPASRP